MRTNLSRSAAVAASLLPLFLLGPSAQAQGAAVSPASRADLEGDGSTTYPLGRHDMRLQQLHADLPPSLTTLLGHAYRRDAIATRGTVTAFSTDLEVRLSIAATTPDAPSRDFAQNRGTGEVVVLPRTTISFPATSRPGTAPAPSFDLIVPYAVPFARPAGAVVCLETVVYGNSTASGNDRNFTPYIDAHALSRSGATSQPGFRYGTGCAAQGRTTPHSAVFRLERDGGGALELTIDSRDGARSTAAGAPALVTLLVGLSEDNRPWPGAASGGCTLLTQIHAHIPLPGTADVNGDWNGALPGLANLPIGLQFHAQTVSGNLATGDLTFSDGSVLTVPGVEPTPIAVSRIAAGSDHTATRGTTSFSVPVTSFF